MGEIPQPYEPGVQCTNCWGTGKAFGDYDTPKRVYATFAGLVSQGSPYTCPPNGTWILTQDPIRPCEYWGFFDITCEGRDKLLVIHWNINGAQTNLYAVWHGEIAWFEPDDLNVECNQSFNNDNILIGGTGRIH